MFGFVQLLYEPQHHVQGIQQFLAKRGIVHRFVPLELPIRHLVHRLGCLNIRLPGNGRKVHHHGNAGHLGFLPVQMGHFPMKAQRSRRFAMFLAPMLLCPSMRAFKRTIRYSSFSQGFQLFWGCAIFAWIASISRRRSKRALGLVASGLFEDRVSVSAKTCPDFGDSGTNLRL